MGNAFHLGYWILPQDMLLPTAVMIAVLGLPLWWLGARRIGRFLLGIALLLFLLEFVIVPLFVEILGHVPTWVLALLPILIGFHLLRAVLNLFLGKEVVGPLLAWGIGLGLQRLAGVHRPIGNLLHGFMGLLVSRSPTKRYLALSLLLILASSSGFTMRQCADPGTFVHPVMDPGPGYPYLYPDFSPGPEGHRVWQWDPGGAWAPGVMGTGHLTGRE